MIWEFVGYFSSLLVLISLLMTSVVKLRIINGIGAAIFTVYAVAIGSYPTAIMNFCLVIINIWFLVKVLRSKTLFSLTESSTQDAAATHFVEFFRDDIARIFPDHDFGRTEEYCFMVYADANPVGILKGSFVKADALEVTLDYAAPSHRDCSVGTYLYGRLKEKGVKTLQCHTKDQTHKAYLTKMGFRAQDDLFIKDL